MASTNVGENRCWRCVVDGDAGAGAGGGGVDSLVSASSRAEKSAER